MGGGVRRHRSGFSASAVAAALSLLVVSATAALAARAPALPAAAVAVARVARGPARAGAPAASTDPFTTAAMRAYLRTRQGDITAAMFILANHELFLYRPGVREQTASIIKVDILATLLHQEELVSRPLDADDEALATGMIEASDNDDATALWDEVGGAAAIAQFDAAAGLTDTAPNTAGYWGETLTTALDQVRLLQHIVLANPLLDGAARAYELGLMENVIASERWGVCAGPPSGATVALKNGWVPIVAGNWQINSIGYVAGQGRAYIVAVLTNENATEGYGIATIEGMSRIIWSDLAPGAKR
jgi:hypothetical protein